MEKAFLYLPSSQTLAVGALIPEQQTNRILTFQLMDGEWQLKDSVSRSYPRQA